MARKPDEMAIVLIDIYRNDDGKRKGKYRISKQQFKSIAGKEVLKDAYLWKVDSLLREEGFIILDMRTERDELAILSINTVMRHFQSLGNDIIEDHIIDQYADREW